MFKGGDNFIGVLLVGLCLVAAGVMLWAILTDRELSYGGPNWLIWILVGIFIVGTGYGLYQSFRVGRGKQWPDPGTGQRSLWDRIRGKNGDPTAP